MRRVVLIGSAVVASAAIAVAAAIELARNDGDGDAAPPTPPATSIDASTPASSIGTEATGGLPELPAPEALGPGWVLAATPIEQSQTDGGFPITCDFGDPVSTLHPSTEQQLQSYRNEVDGHGMYLALVRLDPDGASALMDDARRAVADCEARAASGTELLVRPLVSVVPPAELAGAGDTVVGRSMIGVDGDSDDTWFVMRRADGVVAYGLLYSRMGAESVEADDLAALGQLLGGLLSAV